MNMAHESCDMMIFLKECCLAGDQDARVQTKKLGD
jgi:hypothetical protein